MQSMAVAAKKIPYPKKWFVVVSIVLVAAMIGMAYLSYDSIEPFTRYFWMAMMVVLGLPLVILFIPPMFTDHYQGEKSIRLRMGILMNSSIPYEWIKGVSDTSVKFGGVRIGIGVKYVPKVRTVFITSSFDDLITLHLDGPRSLGGLLKPEVDKIVLSVKDKTSFVSWVKAKAGIAEEG